MPLLPQKQYFAFSISHNNGNIINANMKYITVEKSSRHRNVIKQVLSVLPSNTYK